MSRTHTKRPARAPRVLLGDQWARAALWSAVVSTVVFLPDAQTRWILPKVAVIALAAVLATRAEATGRLPRWWLAALAGGAALMMVAALAGDAPLAQLMGRWPRYEGVVTVSAYAATVWLGARLLGPVARRVRFTLLARASAWTAIALGFVATLEALGARPIASDAFRPGSLTGSATDQGILGAALGLVLLVAAIRAWGSSPWLLWTGLAAATASVVLSASRAASGAFLVGVAVVAVLSLTRGRSAGRTSPEWAGGVALSSATAVVAVIGVVLVPLARQRVVADIGSGAALSDRPLIWSDAWGVLRERLALGWGPSGFQDVVAQAHSRRWFEDVGPFTTLDSPHSAVLQIAGAGGVVLLVGALVVSGMLWGRAVTLARGVSAADADLGIAGAAVVAATGVALLFSLTSPAALTVALLLGGAVLAREPQERTGRRSRWVTVGVGVWAMALATTAVAEVPLAVGESAAARGDVAGAQEAFEAAVSLRPWDADTRSIAAQSLAAAAESGAAAAAPLAQQWAREALVKTPSSIEAAEALAVAQFAAGDAGGAAVTWGSLADRRPDDWFIAARHAAALEGAGDHLGAIQEATRAVTLDPKNPELTAFKASLIDR